MTQGFVVDASVAVKWVIEEPGSRMARSLFQARLEAPDFLLIECSNVFWKKVVLDELTAEQATARLVALTEAPVHFAPCGGLLGSALRLSLDLRHPVYDCLYLALAIQTDLVLVTDDRAFVSVAKRFGRGESVRFLRQLGKR